MTLEPMPDVGPSPDERLNHLTWTVMQLSNLLNKLETRMDVLQRDIKELKELKELKP